MTSGQDGIDGTAVLGSADGQTLIDGDDAVPREASVPLMEDTWR